MRNSWNGVGERVGLARGGGTVKKREHLRDRGRERVGELQREVLGWRPVQEVWDCAEQGEQRGTCEQTGGEGCETARELHMGTWSSARLRGKPVRGV